MRQKFNLTNKNYNATVVIVTKLIDLENCDNLQGTSIFGSQVIVDKSAKVGDIGLFFPVECQLSHEFVSNNNLYRDKTLNVDQTKSGYFEKNRRVRCMKLRCNKSEGLFIPLTSLSYLNIDPPEVGVSFNTITIGNIKRDICDKYYIKRSQPGGRNKKGKGKNEYKNILIENQFKFHIDTINLKRNIDYLTPDKVISISSKWHGTSFVISNVLTKKKLNIIEKSLKLIGVNIVDTEYKLLCSSRRVIKNDKVKDPGFYNFDIWTDIGKKLNDIVPKGISLYGEAVGFMPTGAAIQSAKKGTYDYGCAASEYKIIVYKMTFTNSDGISYTIPWLPMVEFCKKHGIETPPLYFYGYAKDAFDISIDDENKWREEFLEKLSTKSEWGLNDVDCLYCKNKVPSEGVVLRVEDTTDYDLFTAKLKNFRFLDEETKLLDAGNENIEDTQEDNINT